MTSTRESTAGSGALAGRAAPHPAASRRGPVLDDQQADRIAALRIVVAQVGCVAAIVISNAVVIVADRFHWWANFILVPGAIVTAIGFGLRRRNPVRFVVGWLGAIVLTTGLLLLGGAMGALWPLMIIVPCLGPVALFAVRPADASIQAILDTVAGLGAVAVALGGMFLGLHADLLEPGRSRWWVGFMLGAGGVPIVNGLVLLARRHRGSYWFSTAVLLLAFGGFAILAALRELHR